MTFKTQIALRNSDYYFGEKEKDYNGLLNCPPILYFSQPVTNK